MFKPATAVALATTLLLVSCSSYGGKHVIGQTEKIEIVEAGLSFTARIDTGAKSSSIHAIDIEIENGRKNISENVGKEIRFKVINEKNEAAMIKTRVKDVVTIKNAQGKEFRYVVELSLSWNNISKKVRINLRDRDRMKYKLLIGRNWLEDDFLVDVNRSPSN